MMEIMKFFEKHFPGLGAGESAGEKAERLVRTYQELQQARKSLRELRAERDRMRDLRTYSYNPDHQAREDTTREQYLDDRIAIGDSQDYDTRIAAIAEELREIGIDPEPPKQE
jgi:hypothetical protein